MYQTEITIDKTYRGSNERINLKDDKGNLAGYAVTRPDPAKRDNTVALSEFYIHPEQQYRFFLVAFDLEKEEYRDFELSRMEIDVSEQ